METNKILYYTDGHEVMITDSGFRVKKTTYQLNGITRHGFSIIYPTRMPFTIPMVAGAIVFICGALNYVPSFWVKSVTLFNMTMPINFLVMTLGLLFFIPSMIMVLRLKEKYAVKIFTAEGEKNVVVSQSREYISQIIDALNRAFLDLVKQPRKK
ncbi:MAG TPA: hypothetical protein DGG95_05370 [Cytophagales bacterium]|nr:hypothetical protein [Cytophagales bacterium]